MLDEFPTSLRWPTQERIGHIPSIKTSRELDLRKDDLNTTRFPEVTNGVFSRARFQNAPSCALKFAVRPLALLQDR